MAEFYLRGALHLLILCLLCWPVQAPPTKPKPAQKTTIKNQPTASQPARPAAPKPIGSQPIKIDYLVLALYWGPGFCLTSPEACIKGTTEHLTVHGMWPAENGKPMNPAYCGFETPFDLTRLAALRASLEQYWFNYLKSGSDQKFWSHEWTKHGSCARDIPRLHGHKLYFATTVQIVKDLPFLESLAKMNIVPNDTKVYTSADVQKALQQITDGKTMQIDCDLEHHQPVPVLTGVRFCYDNDLNFINCAPVKVRCRNNLIIPATFAGSPSVRSMTN